MNEIQSNEFPETYEDLLKSDVQDMLQAGKEAIKYFMDKDQIPPYEPNFNFKKPANVANRDDMALMPQDLRDAIFGHHEPMTDSQYQSFIKECDDLIVQVEKELAEFKS